MLSAAATLELIKLVHTIVWAAMVACILAIPLSSWKRHFRWTLWFSVIVLAECAVLGLNGGRCPLTDLAARYTADQRPNFDIYLPLWLAEHNKQVFGAIFVTAEFFSVGSWLRSKQRAHTSKPLSRQVE